MVKAGLKSDRWNDFRNRLHFALRRGARVWGAPGIYALLLACGLAIFSVFGMWPAARHLQLLEARAIEQGAAPMRPRAPISISDTSELSGFYKGFPPETLILYITGQINRVAERSGTGITLADYRANDDRSGMVRYEVTVSAHGTYPQLRTFTADCLTHFPTLALEGLTLSRASVTDSAIDAQFRFSVYLRGGPSE
jgi:hypothetical protein